MANVTKVKYYTDDKYDLISEDNLFLYERYLRSNAITSSDTVDTTYKMYQLYMNYFLVFLAERYNNIGLYSEEFLKHGADIVEDYMSFCVTILKNNKKTVHTKVSAVTSFYKWSNKKRFIPYDPLYGRLDRPKRANEERIIQDYFLTEKQIDMISTMLIDGRDDRFDEQDTLLWFIFLDSANRLGAIEKLTVEQINPERCVFENVREKEARYVDVSVSQNTMKLVLWWVEQRKVGYDKLSVEGLFITNHHGQWRQMSRRTIQNRIAKIGSLIGIPDLHPHSIRKSSASLMLEKGADSYLISKYLNHKSMEVLKNYIKPRSSDDIRNQIMSQIDK